MVASQGIFGASQNALLLTSDPDYWQNVKVSRRFREFGQAEKKQAGGVNVLLMMDDYSSISS